MYLKSLTLRGFKSFASSTTMRFEPGINCVVGPNGSGKSNVVDALAWVMGEQGAKNMRGGAMADVIFAGTSQKPALGRAEVSLSIDNSDGALPIDYREVTISRTLFRSGGSEYVINGTACRLLDIQELLSDTGMGKEMHVIIGQGKLDEVLTSSAEDRRGFVEEAAGLLKHRKRKEKALRKLDSMQGSLTRIEDLTVELRRQMGPLARQADAARKAGVIQAELRDAKARILADDLAQQQARLASHSVNDQKIAAARAENSQKLEEARSELSQLEHLASQSRPATAYLGQQAEKLGSLEERYRSLGDLARERQRSLAQAASPDYRGEQPSEIRERAERARTEEEQLNSSVREAAADLEIHVALREQLESKERELEQEISRLNKEIAQSRERAVRHQGKISTTQARIEALTAEHERVSVSSQSAHDRAAAAAEKATEIAEGLALLESDERSPEYDEAMSQLTESRERLRELRGEEQAAREELASLSSRVDVLFMSLEPEDATAWVMEHGHDAKLLAQSLGSRSGWESALDVALLGAAGGLILPDLDRAMEILAQLREANQGHVVMTVLGNAHADESAEAAADSATRAIKTLRLPATKAIRAIDAIEAPEEVRAALAGWIAGTVLAADAETAYELVRSGAPRAVTAVGDVMTAHHVSAGGESPSVLARKSAYEAARDAVAEAAQNLNTVREALEGVKAEVASLTTRVEAFEAQQQETVAAYNEQKSQLRYAQQLEENAKAESQRNADRTAAIEAELSDRRVELSRMQEHDQPESADEATLQLAELQEGMGGAHEATRSERQRETEARLTLRTSEERLRAVTGKSEALMRQAEAAEDRIARAKRAAFRREEASHVAEQVAGNCARALAAVQSLRESVVSERALRLGDQEGIENQLADNRRELDALQQEAAKLADSGHQSELMQAEYRLRYEQLAARASQELGIDAQVLVDEYGPQLPVPMPDGEVPYVRAEQEQRLGKAERAIARLGKINPLALEEHAALEERQRYLSDQLADLKKSREDLLSIVKDVDRHVHEILTQALADVSATFIEVFARLFPGGEGRLVLTDPDNPLTTGIEIEARPPGKRVKRLSLLSGGERSLTAIAFLVAIFMARPSPFYVMDEVEAALDDTNLSRLLDVFRELQQNSQLLVITHQKRTMEIADTLYGISMQDSGVSSVISQRLSELTEATGS